MVLQFQQLGGVKNLDTGSGVNASLASIINNKNAVNVREKQILANLLGTVAPQLLKGGMDALGNRNQRKRDQETLDLQAKILSELITGESDPAPTTIAGDITNNNALPMESLPIGGEPIGKNQFSPNLKSTPPTKEAILGQFIRRSIASGIPYDQAMKAAGEQGYTTAGVAGKLSNKAAQLGINKGTRDAELNNKVVTIMIDGKPVEMPLDEATKRLGVKSTEAAILTANANASAAGEKAQEAIRLRKEKEKVFNSPTVINPVTDAAFTVYDPLTGETKELENSGEIKSMQALYDSDSLSVADRSRIANKVLNGDQQERAIGILGGLHKLVGGSNVLANPEVQASIQQARRESEEAFRNGMITGENEAGVKLNKTVDFMARLQTLRPVGSLAQSPEIATFYAMMNELRGVILQEAKDVNGGRPSDPDYVHLAVGYPQAFSSKEVFLEQSGSKIDQMGSSYLTALILTRQAEKFNEAQKTISQITQKPFAFNTSSRFSVLGSSQAVPLKATTAGSVKSSREQLDAVNKRIESLGDELGI